MVPWLQEQALKAASGAWPVRELSLHLEKDVLGILEGNLCRGNSEAHVTPANPERLFRAASQVCFSLRPGVPQGQAAVVQGTDTTVEWLLGLAVAAAGEPALGGPAPCTSQDGGSASAPSVSVLTM